MFPPYGKSQRPQHYRCPEACGGPYRMGVNGAYNTVEGNVDAYNTVHARVVVEYCSCWCIEYGPWYHGLTLCALARFLRSSLAPSERAYPIGWPQSALVASVGEER